MTASDGFLVHRHPTYLEIEFSGLLVGDTIVAILNEISWAEVRTSHAGLLWDLRQADLSTYSFGDISRVKAYDAEVADRAPLAPADPRSGRRFRIAGVFSGEYDHLILRLWESVTTASDGLERRSFSDIDEARRWITEP